MDKRLYNALDSIRKGIEDLEEAEKNMRVLSSSEKPLFSQLCLRAEGRSVKEREWKAYVTEDWKNHATAFVDAQVEFNKALRKYELKLKAYDAEHLTYKNEGAAIKRQV